MRRKNLLLYKILNFKFLFQIMLSTGILRWFCRSDSRTKFYEWCELWLMLIRFKKATKLDYHYYVTTEISFLLGVLAVIWLMMVSDCLLMSDAGCCDISRIRLLVPEPSLATSCQQLGAGAKLQTAQDTDCWSRHEVSDGNWLIGKP